MIKKLLLICSVLLCNVHAGDTGRLKKTAVTSPKDFETIDTEAAQEIEIIFGTEIRKDGSPTACEVIFTENISATIEKKLKQDKMTRPKNISINAASCNKDQQNNKSTSPSANNKFNNLYAQYGTLQNRDWLNRHDLTPEACKKRIYPKIAAIKVAIFHSLNLKT